MGAALSLNVQFWGVQLGMSMGVSLALPPDVTFGFLWDARAVNKLVSKLMLNAVSVPCLTVMPLCHEST